MAAGKVGADAPGRYVVTNTAAGAVLVDSATGQTWVLHPGHDGPTSVSMPPAWEPATRLDTREATDKWKEMEWRRRREIEAAKPAK